MNRFQRKAVFFLYRVLQTLLFPAILLYLFSRWLRDRNCFGSLRERFGELPALWQKTVPGAIWLHAVSVGEALAAVPLVEELRRRAPRAPIYLSTSTVPGHAVARTRLQGKVDGIFYAPYDFAWAVRRVLARLKPSILVILETEIWPNFFNEARRIGCGLVMVNARISDRALGRYRRFRWIFGSVLPLCNRIGAQSPEMAARFIEAGATPESVRVTGNLKYDFSPPVIAEDSPALAFIRASARPLFVAASTSADDAIEEEDGVIDAYRRLPGWRLLLAPRKPDRFDAVSRKLEASGLRWTRRSALTDPEADVLLLDSIGELSGLFAWATAVFMGGTVAQRGGHNILEPAAFGKPVIAGPHLENFRDIEEHFEKHNAVIRISSLAELSDAVLRADQALGRRALAAANLQRGAAARAADEVMAVYGSSYPRDYTPQPRRAFLWVLSRLWSHIAARSRSRQAACAQQLPVPVVSVGKITSGGTGKTPVIVSLIRDFAARTPALLARGHGRDTSEIVILKRGDERPPIALTGDEAQLCMRAAAVPIGIGGNRLGAARRLLAEAPGVGLFFLDDGFQHLQLKRDFDLVLIDTLHPFGGGELQPLGRLREPLEGLARADAFILTRSDEAPNRAAIEHHLRQWNRHAPIFHSRVEARRWTNERDETIPVRALNGLRSLAFCGLGNPRAFWRSLDQLGVAAVERIDYGDHHRYNPREFQRLVRHAKDIGVTALLTTEKDAVNLCPEFGRMAAPLPLFWLEIVVLIDGREELIRLMEERLVEGRLLEEKFGKKTKSL